MAETKIKIIQLQEIADVYTGLPLSRYRKQSNLIRRPVVSLRSKDEDSAILMPKSELVPMEIYEKESFSKYLLNDKDIIFQVQSPNSVFYYEEKVNHKRIKPIVPSTYIIIRIKKELENQYNHQYITEILKSDFVKRQFNKYSEGKRSIMSINNLKNIEIPIISLSKQNDFSKLLELINKKIEIEMEQIMNAKMMKEGIINKIINEEEYNEF